MSATVTIGNVGQTIQCPPGQTILKAAVLAGIDYPYACASGNCGQCLSRLDAGAVTMLPRGDASISVEQIAAGMTLACRAIPQGDAAVTWLGRGRK